MLKMKNPFIKLYQLISSFNTRYLSAGLVMLVLSACQTHPPYPQAISVASFEGEWLDQNGILSIFNNGQFQTKTTDGTDTLLAAGTYQKISPTFAKIELQSRLRKTITQVNCVLATNRKMNCTASSGLQFTLLRRVKF